MRNLGITKNRKINTLRLISLLLLMIFGVLFTNFDQINQPTLGLSAGGPQNIPQPTIKDIQ